MPKPNNNTNPSEQVVRIPMMDVRAAVVPNSVDEKGRSIDVVFGTETPVKRYSWVRDEYFNEVLSFEPSHIRMDRIDQGVVPLLDNHRSWSGSEGVLGSISNVRIEGGKGYCTLRFADTPDVENTWQKVRQGHIKGVSVGYAIHRMELQPAKDPNDKSELPTYRAVDWEPMEVSMAPIPADAFSGTRSNEQQLYPVTLINNTTSNTETDMKREQIIALLEKRGISFDANATDEQLLALVERAMNTPAPAPAPAPTPAPAAGDDQAARATAATAERQRVLDIQSICRKAGVEEATITKYIDENTSIEAVRAAVLERYQAADPNKGAAPGVSVGRDREVEGRREAAVDALVLRSAQVGGYKPTADAAAVEQYRYMTLMDHAKRALENLGIDYRGLDPMELVKRAITSSGSDFPVLLEGTNRRILLAAYSSIADTWRQFCSIGSVSDFREYKRLRVGSMFASLDQVNENGEFKNKPMTDADYEKISVGTFGNTINVSRQMIINDDLNGFTRLTANLGRAAARTIELKVYELLAQNSGLGPNMVDGNPLFDASHGNIGTGAAISMDSLDADRIVMAKQKDKDGNDFLDLRPSILLLPIGLGAAARTYNDAAYDPDSTGKFQKPNTVKGLVNTIVDTPRLTGTRRYMFADPNIAPVLEVAFLNGVQTPFMDSQEGFKVDGMEWKIRHDFGVAAIGYQGAVTNAGA